MGRNYYEVSAVCTLAHGMKTGLRSWDDDDDDDDDDNDNDNDWLVVWNIFYFCIYWEESSQLTNIFQRG